MMQNWMHAVVETAETLESDAYVAGMIAVFIRNQNAIDAARAGKLTGSRLADFERGILRAEGYSIRGIYNADGIETYHAA